MVGLEGEVMGITFSRFRNDPVVLLSTSVHLSVSYGASLCGLVFLWLLATLSETSVARLDRSA